MHFISADQLHITLQVIVAMPQSGDSLEYLRPASISTSSPASRLGGHWKTPHYREVEQALSLEASPLHTRPYH